MSTFSLASRALKLDTAADLSAHTQPLHSPSTPITHIDLSGNTIGVGAASALADILSKTPTLESANLADIFTGRLLSEIPQALDALLTALLKCPKLHTIDLSDNAFGLNTVEPLRPFLSQCVSLRHLYLNNNGLGPAAGTLVAEALVSLAANKTKARESAKGEDAVVPDLETVVCGRNRLENGSMAAWVKAYRANDKVQSVKMVQNGIRQEGIAALLQHGLSSCTNLRLLDLQDNTFTSLAGKTLADVLPRWPELRELGVGDCLLGARGGRVVGEALAQGGNQKLEVLRLQYNEIDTKALAAVAAAVKSEKALPRVRRVEVNGNKFSEEDPSIEVLTELLGKRKEEQAGEFEGVGEEDEEAWGLDELDELDDDEDEDEDGEDAEEDAEEASVVRDADLAENEPVAQKNDPEVDELAEALSKSDLK